MAVGTSRCRMAARPRPKTGIDRSLEWGSTTLSASYSRTRTRMTFDAEDLNALFAGFSQFGPEGEAIADRYDADDKRYEVAAVGVRYDPGGWFAFDSNLAKSADVNLRFTWCIRSGS